MAKRLENCNDTIEAACGPDIKINDTELSAIENCKEKMHEYKIKSNICQVGRGSK